jgi:hypothetical protein
MTKAETKAALIAALKKAIEDALSDEVLQKGSLQRKLAFNPQKDVSPQDKLKTAQWQTENFGNEVGKGQKYREDLPRLEGAGRDRALMKLGAQTQTRLGEDGKRQFLLHRGMGSVEDRSSVGPATVKQTAKTGWTPDVRIAGIFGYHVSAWIHEDNIHAIPNQLGNVGSYEDYYEPGKNPLKEAPTVGRLGTLKGPNEFSDEKEIIVGPHESPIKKPNAAPAPKNPRILQLHRDRVYKKHLALMTHTSGAYKDMDLGPDAEEARRTKTRELEALRDNAQDSALAAGLPKEELESLRTRAIDTFYYNL